MNTRAFTRTEDRVAESALIGGGTAEQRVRYVQSKTGLSNSEAEALLAQTKARNEARRSQTKNVMAVLSSGAAEAVMPILIFQGLLVAGMLALAGYFATTSRWFFAVVCGVFALVNLLNARGAYLRSRRKADQSTPKDDPSDASPP